MQRQSFALSSPVPHLLGTNGVPSEEQTKRISSFAIAAKAELSRLESQMDALSLTHAQMTRQLEEHTALLSPIRRLPPELLAEIFQHSLPSYPQTPRTSQAPLLLCRVCSQWRSISMSTSSLWCSIGIDIEAPSTLVTLQTMLERSGSRHSLDISLHFPPGQSVKHYTYDGHITEKILSAIISVSSRWRDLYIQNVPFSWAQRIYNIPAKDLASLESLTLLSDFRLTSSDVTATDDQRGFTLSPDGFRSALAFQKLSLSGPLAYMPTLSLHYPLNQITHLTLDNGCYFPSYTTHDLYYIFSHCPMLASCVIHTPHNLNNTIHDHPVVSALALIDWTLRMRSAKELAPLLDCLAFPCLRHLSLETIRSSYWEWPEKAFDALIFRSALTVTQHDRDRAAQTISYHFATASPSTTSAHIDNLDVTDLTPHGREVLRRLHLQKWTSP